MLIFRACLGYLWLQKLQNRAARVLTLSRYGHDADANRLFRQLNGKDCDEHSVSNTNSPNGLQVFK